MDNFTDYTAKEIETTRGFFEQYIKFETNKEYLQELERVLAIVRAIDDIGKGTKWLTKITEEI